MVGRWSDGAVEATGDRGGFDGVRRPRGLLPPWLLAGLLPYGPAVQAGVAGLGAFSTVIGLAVGAQVIRRDLGR